MGIANRTRTSAELTGGNTTQKNLGIIIEEHGHQGNQRGVGYSIDVRSNPAASQTANFGLAINN